VSGITQGYKSVNTSKNRLFLSKLKFCTIFFCIYQKKAVPLQAIYERYSEKIYVHSIFGMSDGSAAGDGG
jgi:hypothetical protein